MHTKKTQGASLQAPPIQELKKKHTCLGQACAFSCCGGIIFIIVSILFVYWALSPKMKNITALPKNLLMEIPLYEEEKIDQIVHTSFKRKKETKKYLIENHPKIKTLHKKIAKETNEPKEKYEISWATLPAKPSFIFAYYKQQLSEYGFTIQTKKIHNGASILFSDTSYTGTLSIIDRPNHPGTDVVTLNIMTQ